MAAEQLCHFSCVPLLGGGGLQNLLSTRLLRRLQWVPEGCPAQAHTCALAALARNLLRYSLLLLMPSIVSCLT